MDISQVSEIIKRISDGIEDACHKCLSDNSGIVVMAITEQLWCGMDGDSENLEPTYDNDPYFEQQGEWYHRNDAYKAWKRAITPPRRGSLLDLPARPDNVPNLYIDGTFYGQISAATDADGISLDPGSGNGPAIVDKYGDQILEMGDTACRFFNDEYMLPAIESFYAKCGYQ